MPTEKGKITIRQILILFLLSTLSPAIRLFPQLCAKLGGIACWVAPIIGALPLIVLLVMYNNVFRNKDIGNLSEFFERAVGKPAAKIILAIYLFWIIMLYLLYIRYYAERLLASIFPNTSINFLFVLILIVTYIPIRGKIETLARFAEIALLLFSIVFAVFYIFLLPTVRIGNLLPLTYFDIWPAVKSAYPVISIWGYLTLFFILGNHIKDKDQLKKPAKKKTLLLVIMSTLLMVTVVGSLGYENTMRMSLPFFNATKVISVMKSFDRFEAILLSVWIISDFIIITLFGKFVCNLTKQLFGVSEGKYFASPVILLGYSGGLYVAINRFELSNFTNLIGLPMNILISYFFPLLAFAIGKLRKKV